MHFRTAFLCAAMLLGVAATSSAQAVSLQFNDGRVTLNAQDAPLRAILFEWARLGGTKFVNGERLGGTPVTLELTDMPERAALDVLLRTAAGYVVTARQEPGGPSTLGGVIILATTSAPRTQGPVTFGAATVQQQQPQRPIQEDATEERTGVIAAPVLAGAPTPPAVPGPNVIRVGANGLPQPNLPGVQSPFVQPQQQQPESAQTPAQPGPARPATTVQTLPGTSRPGEITPPPPAQPQPAR